MLIAHALRLFGFPKAPERPPVDARLAEIDWAAVDWKYLTSWGGEPREIAPGFDIRENDWHSIIDPETGKSRQIEGTDPVYGARLHLALCYLERAGDIAIFATCEVSNGIWLIFVPRDAAIGKGIAAERHDLAHA